MVVPLQLMESHGPLGGQSAIHGSQIRFARLLLFTTLVSFAGALLREEALSGIFEAIKFPLLGAVIAYLFYLNPRLRFTPSALTMWLFFSVVAISTLYNSSDSPDLLASISVFLIITVYFQAVSNLRYAELIFIPAIRWFAFSTVIISIAFLASSDSFIGGRFAAGFTNTNAASGFLAIAIVVLSHMVIFEKRSVLLALGLVAAIGLMLLTKGRGGLIATVVPIAVMLLSNGRQRSTRVNLMRAAGIILALWLAASIEISETTSATELGFLSYRAFELGAREVIIERHYAAFSHSPFIGAGAVVDLFSPYGRTSGESSYTDLLALSGGIGILLIGLLVIRALWHHWFRTESRLGFYILITALLLSISEGYFVSIASAVSMILWALLAVSARNELKR